MDEHPAAPERSTTDAERRGRVGRKRGIWILLLSIAALLALAWFLTHRNSNADKARAGHKPPLAVAVAAATKGSVPIQVDALGTVTPLAEVAVQPQVSGVIAAVLYREGQIVAKGAPLVVIDPRPFQLALQQAEAALARDEAQLQIAQLTLDRYRTLSAQDSIAGQDVDTQAATVKQLAGAVAGDRAAIGAARLNLTFSRVSAPVSGRIGLRTADLGAYVTPAGGGVATIAQLTPIDVEFSVPQQDLTRIRTRLAAGSSPPATALDETRTRVLAQGQFLTLDNAVDAATGTVKAKARFANTDGALFPGQFVNTRLLLEVQEDVVLVPSAAVRTGPRGDFVYVVSPASKATFRSVRRGPTSGDLVSISQGLAVGEQVVTAGGDQLTDGAQVVLSNAGNPNSATHQHPGR
ncbi:efflux RND transporter periplasmic adaptor subunit [Brevundimonas sp. 2YAF1]|uniref:efflux RND transporter periplasmic adaptor subunit n=1 Tax=Brevundimonas sp. 2YAF1 TaxID=3233024 RepID=UPI003F905068